VQFLGYPMRVTYSTNILGRVFGGDGVPLDSGPDLSQDPQLPIGGPSVNPVRRLLASKMIRTDVPMIDVFNSLVESQKIPIFSVAGEPYNPLLARIGIQADADIVVFGGLGLIFDDYHFFRTRFEDAGVFARTVMFVNLASDPIVERLLVPVGGEFLFVLVKVVGSKTRYYLYLCVYVYMCICVYVHILLS